MSKSSEKRNEAKVAAARGTLERSVANFVEELAKSVHGPHPSSRQIAEITRSVVADMSLGKYL